MDYLGQSLSQTTLSINTHWTSLLSCSDTTMHLDRSIDIQYRFNIDIQYNYGHPGGLELSEMEG
jgi:hypothetical protein